MNNRQLEQYEWDRLQKKVELTTKPMPEYQPPRAERDIPRERMAEHGVAPWDTVDGQERIEAENKKHQIEKE